MYVVAWLLTDAASLLATVAEHAVLRWFGVRPMFVHSVWRGTHYVSFSLLVGAPRFGFPPGPGRSVFSTCEWRVSRLCKADVDWEGLAEKARQRAIALGEESPCPK